MLDETTIATLKREKAALEEIMKNGRARIKALETVLKAYDVSPPSTNGRTPRRQVASSGTRVTKRDIVMSVLKEGQPRSPAEILKVANERGADMTQPNLANLLTTSPLFERVGEKQWSLTEFDDE